MNESKGLIDSWLMSNEIRSTITHSLKRLYELQATFLFDQYEPVKASPPDAGIPFLRRLERWLECFSDSEDQWNAYYALRYFLFVGVLETEEMYRCAVQNHLYPWLVEAANIDIFASDVDRILEAEMRACWPCPISDSLRINGLLHRTNLNSQDLRPDWYSLNWLGDKSAIKKYVAKKEIRYLILFEDFVGSGTQCTRAINFALNAFEGPVFLCPLVVCSPGDQRLRELQSSSSGRLSYSPVVVLPKNCLIQPDPSTDEPGSFAKLRVAMEHGYTKYLESGAPLNGGAFGFKGVGCLYGSYSNCPNNAPPIFHAYSKTWARPLFPRRSRI